VVATLEVGGARFDRLDQPGALGRLEVVLVGGIELGLGSLRQIRALVQDVSATSGG
jgi:hypothetical protein